MKYCTKCGVRKDLSDFYCDKRAKNGHKSRCKVCIDVDNTRYYENNTEKIDEFRRKYREINREKRRDSGRRYREENNEKIKESGRRYYRNNLEKLARRCANYRLENPCKYDASKKLCAALKNRSLTKPKNCECCKDQRLLDGHHCDYSKPLDVMWLCRRCHKQWHRHNESTNG